MKGGGSQAEIEESGLVYSTDSEPGISRVRRGKGFSYVTETGRPLRDAATLQRIRSLVIPPAWKDVWICPKRRGFVQATGRDQKGRKQSIYHPDWVLLRQESKFNRLLEFGRSLPKIREQVDHDLRQKRLTKTKVLATVVSLLEQTLIRIGNERYTKENRSFGLTTLRSRHAEVGATFIQFRFKGKSGQSHQIRLSDRRLANILRQCQELPGQNLLTYLDEDGHHATIDSSDVNDYLASIAMPGITAKHFRTWAGTVEAVKLIREQQPQSDRALAKVIKQVAQRLGNTASVCRTYYIHPKVIEGYLDAEWVTKDLPRVRSPYKTPIEVLTLDNVLSSKA